MQNFSLVANQFCAKKQQFAAIICQSQFAQNCPISLLRNSSFAQFRKIFKMYFLDLKGFKPVSEFWKNLVIGHFYIFDQWLSRWVRISWAHTLFIGAKALGAPRGWGGGGSGSGPRILHKSWFFRHWIHCDLKVSSKN